MTHTALSDADYQRLSTILTRLGPQGSMNLEQLDGFFAALLAGPEPITPKDCLPAILGAAYDDERAFGSPKALEQFVKLLMGHWLDIADTLHHDRPFHPWLEADEHGEVRGNDWAEGFRQGMQLLNDDWALLFDDAAHAPLLSPILALAFERAPDPDMQAYVGHVDPAQREAWLAELSESVGGIHRFFAGLRAELAAEEAGDD